MNSILCYDAAQHITTVMRVNGIASSSQCMRVRDIICGIICAITQPMLRMYCRMRTIRTSCAPNLRGESTRRKKGSVLNLTGKPVVMMCGRKPGASSSALAPHAVRHPCVTAVAGNGREHGQAGMQACLLRSRKRAAGSEIGLQ